MISVCMATYNGASFIEEQLKSILSQLAPCDEVIVSDDGSSDATLARIHALGDSRIRVLAHAHIGSTCSFYTALRYAKGDFIFLADQDDVWLDGKVTRCLQALHTCDLVVSDARVTDSSLHIIAPSLFQIVGSKEGLFSNWLACSFYGSTMAFRRSVLEASIPFPNAGYIAHDWWIGIVAEMTGNVHFLQEPLILYRRHEATVTKLKKGSLLYRSQRPLWIKIYARLQMVYYIIRYRLTHLSK